MSTGRDKALQAYRQAQETGNWQAAAELLFKAMPKPRKKRGRRSGCIWPPPIIEFRFACGYTVAFSVWTKAGEDPDFKRGQRLAESHYRFRFGRKPMVTGQRLIPEAEWRARYTDAPPPTRVGTEPVGDRAGKCVTGWMQASDAYWQQGAQAA